MSRIVTIKSLPGIENQVPGIENQAKESILESTGRQVGKTIKEALVTGVSLPADTLAGSIPIINYAKNLPVKIVNALPLPDSVKQAYSTFGVAPDIPSYEKIQEYLPVSWPTSEQTNKFIDTQTGDYFKSRNAMERFSHDLVSDITSLIVPLKGKLPFTNTIKSIAKFVGTVAAGIGAQRLAEKVGLGPLWQGAAKLATVAGLGIIGSRNNVSQKAQELQDAFTDEIKGINIHSNDLEKKSQELNRLIKGKDFKNIGKVKKTLRDFEELATGNKQQLIEENISKFENVNKIENEILRNKEKFYINKSKNIASNQKIDAKQLHSKLKQFEKYLEGSHFEDKNIVEKQLSATLNAIENEVLSPRNAQYNVSLNKFLELEEGIEANILKWQNSKNAQEYERAISKSKNLNKLINSEVEKFGEKNAEFSKFRKIGKDLKSQNIERNLNLQKNYKNEIKNISKDIKPETSLEKLIDFKKDINDKLIKLETSGKETGSEYGFYKSIEDVLNFKIAEFAKENPEVADLFYESEGLNYGLKYQSKATEFLSKHANISKVIKSPLIKGLFLGSLLKSSGTPTAIGIGASAQLLKGAKVLSEFKDLITKSPQAAKIYANTLEAALRKNAPLLIQSWKDLDKLAIQYDDKKNKSRIVTIKSLPNS